MSEPNLIRLSPNVRPEMLSVSFWTDRAACPCQPVMDQKQIGQWNAEALRTRMLHADGSSSYILNDLRAFRGGAGRDVLEHAFPAFSAEQPWYTEGGPVSETAWNALIAPLNPGGINDLNPVRPGICVRRSFLRALPSAQFYTDDISDWYCDCAALSGIMLNEPLLVLWQDSAGAWLYVITRYYAGWMPAADVALCRGDAEFETALALSGGPSAAPDSCAEAQARLHLVTISADRVQLGPDYFAEPDSAGSGAELFMGTVLEALPWDSPGLDSAFGLRLPYASYALRIPFRAADGYTEYRCAAVPASLCCEGWMPYTAANVIELGFQSLGRRYGWGGQYYSRDCSSLSQEIFRCFGFCLPRDGGEQSSMPGHSVSFDGMDPRQKREAFDALPAGSLLYLPGHIMIYLGRDKGRYFVLSALGSYYPEYEPRRRIPAFSVSINDLESTFRKDGQSWFSHISRAMELRP